MLEEMIKYFRDPLLPGEILFLIKERETSISFDVTTIEENISYLGGIDYKALEDVYFVCIKFMVVSRFNRRISELYGLY